MTRIQELETNHYDRITVVDHNLTGKRMLTASADHHIKVYERATIDSDPVLKDTWTAHNADIRDAKWFHPTLGTHIATISNDLTLKIWQHDPSQAPNSGRTFRRLTVISSQSGVPFVSLSIKHIAPSSTYLAVIDRTGYLTIYTPDSPDNFVNWASIYKTNVVDGGTPMRSAETSFSVCFDLNVNSVPYILNLAASTPNIVSFAVCALDVLKVYRSSFTSAQNFYEAAHSEHHRSLIRSIAWSNGNIRGFDVLATGCADGTVRIFELHTSSSPSATAAQTTSTGSTGPAKQTPQSSLTTAIVGRASNQHSSSATHTSRGSTSNSASPFIHKLTASSPIENEHLADCLAVRFDLTGNLLASMDASGRTIYWKRSVNIVDGDGQPQSEWITFAEEAEGESEDELGGAISGEETRED